MFLFSRDHLHPAEKRQQEFQVIHMMRPRDAAGDEARGKCAEGQVRIDLDQLESRRVRFLFEFLAMVSACLRLVVPVEDCLRTPST